MGWCIGSTEKAKGEKTEGQLPGGSVILIRRMRTIWTNGEGREGRQQLSGRNPCPTLRKGKVKKGFGEHKRDPFTKFCLGPWTLNLNKYPFTPRRSLARRAWGVEEGTTFKEYLPMSDNFANYPT